MPKVSEVCRHVRSKNAGPFWITIDVSFSDAKTYERHVDAPALQPAAIARLYDVDEAQVKRFPIPDLAVLRSRIRGAGPRAARWSATCTVASST